MNKELNCMYREVDRNLDFTGREEKVRKFWRENDIFRKSMEQRQGCPTYIGKVLILGISMPIVYAVFNLITGFIR